jgi:hypothetical protein
MAVDDRKRQRPVRHGWQRTRPVQISFLRLPEGPGNAMPCRARVLLLCIRALVLGVPKRIGEGFGLARNIFDRVRWIMLGTEGTGQ